METETQRPKNERTPGDPVGEGRREPGERAPRPPFRPAPFPAGPGRPVPWREPQAQNPRSSQDPGSINEPNDPQAHADPALRPELYRESLNAAARSQEAPEEGPAYYPYDSMNPAQSDGSARPAREEGFNGPDGPDNLDSLGNFARPGRPDGYISPDDPDNLDGLGNFAGPGRPIPWREPQVANLREPQDPFQAANSCNPENLRSLQPPFVEDFPSQNPSELWAANPRSSEDPFQAENLRNPQDPFQAENPRSLENLRSLQPRKKRAPGFFFFLIGGLLLLTAAVFTAINLVEAEQARRAAAALIDALPSELSEELSAQSSLEAKDSSKRPEPDWPMPQRIVNGEEIIGVIEIPRTGLMLPVLSSWDYDKLKRYPCYYHGSIYRKDAVFCSHDYPFQFGGLNVLEDGDEARFLDADGNIFTYAFREQEYLQPTDVEAMTLKDDWDLTLFTCAYNGLARYAYRFEETGFRAKP